MVPSTVALHEAAHAVARIRFGGWIKHVTIVPDEVTAGHVLSVGSDVDGIVGVELGIVLLAGLAAEHVAGRDFDDAVRGAETDIRQAIEASGERLESAMERALEFVHGEWDAIERVALALDAQQTLTSLDVATIMGGV